MPKAREYTAVEIAAHKSVTREGHNHADYKVERFTERDLDGGEVDGARMMLTAPVRALQGLARKNPRSSKPFLNDIEIMAANAYHADVHEAMGSMSHEIREHVDRSPSGDLTAIYTIEARNKLVRITNRMSPTLKGPVDMVIRNHPDKSMRAIWPKDYERRKMRDAIKDGLIWLAREYGLMS